MEGESEALAPCLRNQRAALGNEDFPPVTVQVARDVRSVLGIFLLNSSNLEVCQTRRRSGDQRMIHLQEDACAESHKTHY